MFALSLRRPVKRLFGFVWILFLCGSIIVKLTSKIPEKEKSGSIKPLAQRELVVKETLGDGWIVLL